MAVDVNGFLASALAVVIAFGAIATDQKCTRKTACCGACDRHERAEVRPDCCRIVDSAQIQAAKMVREGHASQPGMVATRWLERPSPVMVVVFVPCRAPIRLSTSPPTPLRV